jgi:putative salt-induced outer membrane protein
MRALLLALPLLLANAEDPTIPPTIKSMLDAAMESGSEADVAVIVKYAKNADPASAELVMRIASDWRNERQQTAQRKLREADFLDLVKGHAELGGYVSTGNTENIGLSAAIQLRREGIEWRHKLRFQADYQESLGVTTQDRYLAAYEPNWKFDDRAYVYGAAQYERDRFSGFNSRFSLSAGAGYSAIKSPAMKLDVELGPAFRQTDFIDQTSESNVAARGSLDFGWKVSRGISVTQTASAYLEQSNSTVATKSALLTKLIGPLSAQFSYSVQFESMPPIGRKTTDTTSRAALVVDF